MLGRVVIGCALVAGCATAQADIIRFKFAGTINEVSGAAGPVQVGDSFTIAYDFNTAASDTDPAPNVGSYDHAIIFLEGEVGSFQPIANHGDIFVLDNGFAGDSYGANVQTPVMQISISLTNLGGGALSGDDMPLDLNFSQWGLTSLFIHVDIGPTFWEARGPITDFSSGVMVDCYPDCNTDGLLTVADFGCFQTRFVQGDRYADCNVDGNLTVADFGCFQTNFVAACP